MINNYDVAGILQTYAEKAKNATTTKKLREVVRDLKEQLHLANIRIEEEQE